MLQYRGIIHCMHTVYRMNPSLQLNEKDEMIAELQQIPAGEAEVGLQHLYTILHVDLHVHVHIY